MNECLEKATKFHQTTYSSDEESSSTSLTASDGQSTNPAQNPLPSIPTQKRSLMSDLRRLRTENLSLNQRITSSNSPSDSAKIAQTIIAPPTRLCYQQQQQQQSNPAMNHLQKGAGKNENVFR